MYIGEKVTGDIRILVKYIIVHSRQGREDFTKGLRYGGGVRLRNGVGAA